MMDARSLYIHSWVSSVPPAPTSDGQDDGHAHHDVTSEDVMLDPNGIPPGIIAIISIPSAPEVAPDVLMAPVETAPQLLLP